MTWKATFKQTLHIRPKPPFHSSVTPSDPSTAFWMKRTFRLKTSSEWKITAIQPIECRWSSVVPVKTLIESGPISSEHVKFPQYSFSVAWPESIISPNCPRVYNIIFLFSRNAHYRQILRYHLRSWGRAHWLSPLSEKEDFCMRFDCSVIS